MTVACSHRGRRRECRLRAAGTFRPRVSYFCRQTKVTKNWLRGIRAGFGFGCKGRILAHRRAPPKNPRFYGGPCNGAYVCFRREVSRMVPAFVFAAAVLCCVLVLSASKTRLARRSYGDAGGSNDCGSAAAALGAETMRIIPAPVVRSPLLRTWAGGIHKGGQPLCAFFSPFLSRKRNGAVGDTSPVS